MKAKSDRALDAFTIITPMLALALLAFGSGSLPPAFGQTARNHAKAGRAAAAMPKTRVSATPHDAIADAAADAADVSVGPVDSKTQKLLQHVVSAQLSAIARDDYAGALTYSVPEFRHSWSPDAFRQMIRSGYGPLTDYRKATFAPARRLADSAFMPVQITSSNGESVAYMYVFRHLPAHAIGTTGLKKPERPSAAAGVWLIDNVSPLDVDDAPLPELPSLPSSNRQPTDQPEHDILIREA